MKKLLIAAALTASVCSFGANINAETFDGTDYALATDDYIVKVNGDASAVTAYGDDTLAAPTKTTEAVQVGENSKYLNLSTESYTLWRTINQGGSETNVAATGTYIDTLVQFTATEDDTSVSVEDGAKLAMWLVKSGEGEDATYTLKVRGFKVTAYNDAFVGEDNDDDGGFNFTLDATNIEPSTWYRLTVKAIEICTEAGFGYTKVGFAIYIDGNLVKPVEKAFADQAVEVFHDEGWFASAEVEQAIGANELIPSLTLTGEVADALYGVGFKGTGAIDSIAWTDKDIYPFPAAPSAAFTLTIAMDEESINSVTYTFGEGDAAVTATVTADTADIEVPANAVVKFTAVAKDWFIAPTIADITMTANTTTPEIKGVEVKAENITFTDTTIPEGKGSDVVAWAKAAGKTPAEVAAAATLFNNYLLNVADLTVDPQIKIVSIDVTKSPVEVVAEVTDANGSTFKKTLDADDIEGALKYKAAATLEALKTAKSKDAIEAGDQFIKVVVE